MPLDKDEALAILEKHLWLTGFVWGVVIGAVGIVVALSILKWAGFL